MYGLSKRVINGQGIHGADPPLAGQVEKDVADVSVGEFRVAAVEMLDDVEVGIEHENTRIAACKQPLVLQRLYTAEVTVFQVVVVVEMP